MNTTAELFELLARGEAAHDGEDVDLLAHSLQCAELLATAAPDDTELQVAGLVHDIGTLLAPGRPETHATTGALAVSALLGDRGARLVARHDVAKRYLVTVDPTYRSQLSPRSVETLREQGGPLAPDERAEFEADASFSALLQLRRADDAAKVPGRTVRPLDAWRATVDAVARARV